MKSSGLEHQLRLVETLTIGRVMHKRDPGETVRLFEAMGSCRIGDGESKLVEARGVGTTALSALEDLVANFRSASSEARKLYFGQRLDALENRVAACEKKAT